MQYNDEQVQQVMDAQKCNRIKAIHMIKRFGDVAKAIAYVNEPPAAKPEVDRKATRAAHAGKKAAPKAAKKAVAELPKKSSEQVKVDMAELDDVIRKALKAGYGHACPVLGVLGKRFAVPSQSQGFPYYRVLAEVGGPSKSELVAVFVSGFYPGGPGPKASITPAVKSSYTVSALLKRIDRKTKREAAAKEAK